MPDDSHLLPLDATSADVVEITGFCNAVGPLSLTLTADTKPTLNISSPLLTVSAGPGPSYTYSCRRPASGTTSFELAWMHGGRTYVLHAALEAGGPVILWPKSEGPKLRLG